MRTTLRWMLPAAGAAFAVASFASTAHAAITGSITAPTAVSVGDSASWTFPTDGAPTTCAVTPPGGVALAPADCSTGTVPLPTTDRSGTYTLQVWNGTDTTVAPADSSSVAVLPAPAQAAASGTGAWALTDVDPNVDGYDCTPDGAAPACTVTPTGSGTATLTAALSGATPGTYSWTVTAHNGTLTSAPTTVSTTVAPPAAPTTSNASTSGYDRTAGWTVSDTDAGLTGYTCTVTAAPSGATSLTPACSATTSPAAVTLPLAGEPVGRYTVDVRAVVNGVDSDPLTLTYDLTNPPAPSTGDPKTQRGTDGTATWAVQDADTAATLHCTVSGPTTVTADCGTAGQVSLTVTGLAHGTYHVDVYAVDDTGTSTTLVLTYLYAPPAPTVSSASAHPQTASGSTRTITWTLTDADPTATFSCSITSPASTTATVSCDPTSGLVTLNLPATAGTYVVTTSAVDGIASDALLLSYTLGAPATPTLTSGAQRQTGTGRGASWTVATDDPSAQLSCAATGPGGSALPAGTCTVAADGTVTLAIPASAPAGSYSVAVTATDAGSSAPLALRYDLFPATPVLATGSGPANQAGLADDTAGTGRAPAWTVTDADPNASYTCAATRPDGVALPTSAVTCLGGTVSLDLAGQPAGTYTVVVTAVDSGVQSSDLDPADVLTLTYALGVPTPTRASGSNPAAQTGTGRSPSWTVSDADAGATFTCSVLRPDGSPLPTGDVTCTAAGAVALNLAGQPAGTYTVKVTAVDAGVTSAGVLTLTYTLTVPNPTLASGSNPANQTAVANDVAGTGRSPSWTVTDADAGATFTCSVLRPDGSPLPTGDVTCTAAGAVALNLAGQPAGTYTVKVTAVDAGVTSAGVLTLTYTLTVPNPTLASGSNPANQTGVANDVAGTGRSPSWTVSDADAGATFTCSVLRPDGSPLPTGDVTCTAAGAVALNLAGQPAGTYTVKVTAIDAGVTSAGVLTLTYTLTVPNPTLATGSKPAVQKGSGATPSWTVTDADGSASITCSATGPSGALPAAEVHCTLGPNGVWLDLATEHAGHYSVVVTANDNGVDAPSTLTLDYDLYPATPTVSSGAPNQKSTGRSPQWTVSDADPFATYDCAVTRPDGRSLPASDITCSGGTVQLDLTGQPAGTYTVVVTATDGGISSADLDPTDVLTLTYTLYPPTPTMLSGQPGQSGVADVNNAGRTPVWSVQVGDPDATLLCTVTGPAATTTPSCVTGTNGISLNLAGLPAGTYTVTVTAVDNGVRSSDLAPADVLTLTYRLIPATPRLASGTAGQTGTAGANNSGRTATWSVLEGDSGAALSCTVSGPAGSTVTQASRCVVGNGGVAIDLTNQPAGAYTVVVTAVDAGVASAGSLVLTYTLFPAAPVATAPTAQTGAGRTPSWIVTDADAGATSLTCSVAGPAGSSPSVDCATFGSVRLTLPNQPGTYTVTVIAVDNGVNSAPLTLTYLLVPPPPTVSTTPASPSNSRAPTWTVTDGMPGVTYVCTASGPTAVGVDCTGSTVHLNLIGAVDGVYTVSILAVDSLGDSSDAAHPLVVTYRLDTTPPAAPTVAVTPSPSQGRTATFTIGGVEPSGTLSCQLSMPTGATVTVPTACATGVTIDLTGQPDGRYTLHVTVTDLAGNVSAETTATYVLDTTAPAAPVASITSPGNDVTPTPTLVVEPGVTLTCSIERFFLPLATVACGTDGTIDLSAYGDGEYEISVSATDAAGNVSPFSAPYVYVLDTAAPATPALASPASPSPVTDPVWRWTSEADTTATCTVTNAAGAVVTGPVACDDLFTGQFGSLPDGAYTLSVVLRDSAGNISRPATSVFVFDRTAPVPPTVVPPTSPSNSTTPRWVITGPRGATLTCTLTRGRTVIFGPDFCPAAGVFSLAGLPDGTYTMRVTATDSAGNVSAASVTTYVLDTAPPPAPTLAYGSPSGGTSRDPFWGFTLPAGTTGRCELLQGGVVIATRSDCHGAVSFTINGPDGLYTVRIVAVDAAGNVSAPLLVGYQLYGHGGGGGAAGGTGTRTGNGSGTTGRPHRPRTGGPAPTTPTLQRIIDHLGSLTGQAAKAVHRASTSVTAVLPSLPVIHDPLTNNVSHAVQNVVNAVSKAGGGTGFPLLLLVVVGIFLMAQSRMDRRDPKLALASVAADDNLQFGPPPSRGDA